MQDLDVVDGLHNAGTWLVRHQDVLLAYAVNIASAMVILFVGFLVARIAANAVTKLLVSRKIDLTVADFLAMIVRYAVIGFTLIAALGRVGVQTASVIALLGAIGLAAGLAFQNSLSNLAAGVLLVVFRPIRIGEFVDIGGSAGTVQKIQIFSTTLQASDGRTIVMPNSTIIAGKIVNYSREPLQRSEFIIGVSYDADVDHVMKVLRDVVNNADDRVLKNKPVVVVLNEMAPSSLNFLVRCWSTYNDSTQLYWDLMADFKRALDANGISIPYPQMDVRLVKANEQHTAQ